MENNNYKFEFNDGYICGFYTVLEEGDFNGQMAEYPDVIESISYGGWFKFENGEFVEDSARKAEMIAKKEKEATWQEAMEAQVTYTAMMTDTMLEE